MRVCTPPQQQDSLVGGLAATARVERRGVKDDALGIAGQHHRVPFAQGLVVEFQPVRAPLSLTHPGSLLPGRTRTPGRHPGRDRGYQGPYGPEELLPPLNSLTFGRTSVR